MKNLIRSQFLLALVAAAGLLLAACSGKHENSIIGKWKTTQGGNTATVTFTKDGKVLNDEGGKTQNGEYSLSPSNTVILKIEGLAIEFDLAYASPDEMTLTPKMALGVPVPKEQAQSQSAKFTRVSQ